MSNVCQSHVSCLESEDFKNLRLETRDKIIFASAIGSEFNKTFKNRYNKVVLEYIRNIRDYNYSQ